MYWRSHDSGSRHNNNRWRRLKTKNHEESLNEKNMLRELKEKMIDYCNRHGMDTNDYQFKKELYARLLLADYYSKPVICIQSSLSHNGENSMVGTARTYRDMSINTILGTLLSHENAHAEKFGKPIELDIDDMIEGLIQLSETTVAILSVFSLAVCIFFCSNFSLSKLMFHKFHTLNGILSLSQKETVFAFLFHMK